ncbi:AAC(3) family N-acetyltransferase [Polynucleobacter sp. MWH-UH2A]|uniref:AAC(3) family N-acetyltransferase n=1 Tax=Polynucleobacter sp. MWH-UH2A TaxID=1855617 RepID=UPI001BFE8A43|nr:AAC(3) family N-acetyltransferase [Polynucleobacter sp. MWH-UH2A]QWD64363.1 AAC(3) family N-acetyltransferase [Polynucleobacter sp. MWH-UH2A]
MALGVKKGDCLFIHSGLKALGKFNANGDINKLDILLNIFLDLVGESGTIVVPTFNFAFCSGGIFDRGKTPCDGMGAFSEHVRTHAEAHRARHPFHSVAAIGKNAVKITNSTSFSEFSEGGFFDALLQLDCKILFYGVAFVETFVHMAEERAKVPYRFWKSFAGDVIDGELRERVSINYYARRFDLEPEPQIDSAKINQYLRVKKVIVSANLGDGNVSICSSKKMVEELIKKFNFEPYFPLVSAPLLSGKV